MCLRPSSPCSESSGSTAQTSMSRRYSFSRRPVPITVPVVPMPVTKWVTRPSVCSQISRPVVL